MKKAIIAPIHSKGPSDTRKRKATAAHTFLSEFARVAKDVDSACSGDPCSEGRRLHKDKFWYVRSDTEDPV